MQPAAPGPLIQIERGDVPTIVSAQPYAFLQHRIAEIPKATYVVVEHAQLSPSTIGPVGVKAVPLPLALPPVTLPIPVELPAIPPIPSLPIHGLLGA